MLWSKNLDFEWTVPVGSVDELGKIAAQQLLNEGADKFIEDIE